MMGDLRDRCPDCGDVDHHGCDRLMSDETDEHAPYIANLEQAVRQLALAVQTHRMDMHTPGGRPCTTCSFSAKALRAVNVEPFVDGRGMGHSEAHDAAIRACVAGNSPAAALNKEGPDE